MRIPALAAFDSSYASVIPDGQLASGANVAGSNLNFSTLSPIPNPPGTSTGSQSKGKQVHQELFIDVLKLLTQKTNSQK